MTLEALIAKWEAEILHLQSLPRSTFWRAADALRIVVLEEGLKTLKRMPADKALSLWRDTAYRLVTDEHGDDYHKAVRHLHATIILEGAKELQKVVTGREAR